MWIFVAMFCAIYVFVGITPIIYFYWYGEWVLFSIFFTAYIVNLVLLACVRGLEW